MNHLQQQQKLLLIDAQKVKSLKAGITTFLTSQITYGETGSVELA